MIGFLCAFPYIKLLAWRGKLPLKNSEVTFEGFSSLALPVLLGVIIGGRLLDFVFYNPAALIEDPGLILRIWEGGMSIHGACIGAVLFLFIYTRFSKKAFGQKMPFLFYTDLIAAYLPFPLFMGRIANFINGELYGRATDVPWAMIFPNGGDIPRHPSQIYEALAEGLVIFIVLNFLVWRRNMLFRNHGLLTALMLIMYSAFRFIIEWFREPSVMVYWFTMGQILSIAFISLGLALLLWLVHLRKTS